MINSIVKRNGKTYTVIEEKYDCVCVNVEIDFAEKPYKRIIKCWWYKSDLDPHITYRDGSIVFIDDLRDHVSAARKKGLRDKWAFTPETVDALLDDIERLRSSQHIKSKNIYSCFHCHLRNKDDKCEGTHENFDNTLTDELLRIPIWCPLYATSVICVKNVTEDSIKKFCKYVTEETWRRVGYIHNKEDNYYHIQYIGIEDVETIKKLFFEYFTSYVYTIIP